MPDAKRPLNCNGKSGVRLNFHIIFSNKIDPAEIETLIKGFPYTKNATIGEQYIDGEFLLNKVTVDFFHVIDKLQNDIFRDKFLIWLPYDEYGGVDAIDPVADEYLKLGLIRDFDILGSSNPSSNRFFSMEKRPLRRRSIYPVVWEKTPLHQGQRLSQSE